MPRTRTREMRLVPRTVETLTPNEKEFYDLLPEKLRAKYLSSLKLLEVDVSTQRRKADYIRARIADEQRVVDALQSHVSEMQKMVADLENGAVSNVNLRAVTALPEIRGVIIRFQRDKAEDTEGGNTPQSG